MFDLQLVIMIAIFSIALGVEIVMFISVQSDCRLLEKFNEELKEQIEKHKGESDENQD